MIETVKKTLNLGIYGRIQKITDYLEEKYNVTNNWLHFRYCVNNFPEEFINTCHYIGLKDDSIIIAANMKLKNSMASLAVICPPMDANCKTDDYSVIFKRNYWQYPSLWYENFDETELTEKEDPKKEMETNIENIFTHLQNFCTTIDLLSKQLKAMPKLQKLTSDFTKDTNEV